MSRIYNSKHFISLFRISCRRCEVRVPALQAYKAARNSYGYTPNIFRTLHTSNWRFTDSGKVVNNESTIPFEDRIKLQMEQLSAENKEGLADTRQSKFWKDGRSKDGVSFDDEQMDARSSRRSLYEDDDYEDTPQRNNQYRRSYSEPENKQSRMGRRNFSESFSDDELGYRGRPIRRAKYDNDFFRTDEYDNANEQGCDDTHESVDLPSIEKNFFKPSSALLSRSTEENEEYLRAHNINVKGSDAPPPIQSFSEQEFPERVLSLLQEFDAPTAIQAQGWSVALSGKDLIGIGQTGSGKTLGYLLPGLIHVRKQFEALEREGLNRQDSPLGLVIAPTRELVQQIMQVYLKYSTPFQMRAVAMFGGASRQRQLDFLRQRPKFIIATPGRLIDFIMEGQVKLNRCGFVVLDEADRMLDMGFEPQIRSIIKHTRKDRQTLMWSATWPEEVRGLAGEFLTDPVQLCVGSTELRANPDIKQHVFVCDEREKNSMLEDLLLTMTETDSSSQAIVFCETKRTVDFVTSKLYRKDIRAQAIHGDKSQASRDRTLNGFRKKQFSVLVATEVAARGLDIPVLKCVINYNFPNDIESYVHRIGRTGRSGNKGLAYTFFTEGDAPRAKALVKVLGDAGQKIPPDLQGLAEASHFGIIKNKKKNNRSKSWGGRGGPGYGRGARW